MLSGVHITYLHLVIVRFSLKRDILVGSHPVTVLDEPQQPLDTIPQQEEEFYFSM